MELLLVLALLGTILGLGLGMFAALDVAQRQALGLVRNQVRAAQNASVARRARARVQIDLVARTIAAEVDRVVGTWHFESDLLEGAFGLDGSQVGARLVEDGFIGRAIDFDTDQPGARASFPVQLDPACDLALGFALECAVRPAAAGTAEIVDVGGSCGLSTAPDGSVRGWFSPRVRRQQGGEGRGAQIPVATGPGVLRAGEWTRLRLEYDRSELRLTIDGALAARQAEEAPVWPVGGPLVVSAERLPFRGSVDCLVLSAVASRELAALPKTVRFAPDSALEIAFDATGALDRTRHTQPAVIGLDYDDGTRQRVEVGLYGTVE